ncbi:restriction endonuclease subunit S [Corynebacterium variabile]|uniref:restriction endonuclease subunit S n=1 Tax=Corynebacterium variabile TaxID=1727 RepID=UPI003FD63B11
MSSTKLEEFATIVDCEHKTAPIDHTGGFFAVGTPAMRGNSINYSEARQISEETFEAWTRRLKPRHNDILFAREAPVGPVVRIPKEENVAPGQRTVLIRIDENTADSGFIFYLLSSPKIQSEIASLSAGSTVAHLNVADVRTLDIGTLPSLSEQHAIAEVLSALDEKIAANSCAMSTVFNLCLSLAQKATQGTSESTLGKVSKSISRGSAPKYADNGYLVLNQKCIRNGRVDTSAGRISYKLPRNPEKVLQAEDILVNSTGQGTLGRVARWTHDIDDVSTDSHVSIVRIDPKLADPTFVGTLVLHKELQIEGFAEGSTGQTELRRDSLAALPLRLPSINRQREVGDQIRTLWSLLDSLEDQSRTLAATRDELLPLLMSGKITVADAEKRIAE